MILKVQFVSILLIFSTICFANSDGKIVFWSKKDRPGTNGDVFILDREGNIEVNLTLDFPGGAFSPEVSPDGSKIAFGAEADKGIDEIWIIDIDGTNLKKITSLGRWSNNPSWSPGGNKIVFSALSDRTSETLECDGNLFYRGCSDIYEIDLISRTVTNISREPAFGYIPAWSPDGANVVFLREISEALGNLGIITDQGTNFQQLVQSEKINSKPSWSPDGSKIAYSIDTPNSIDLWMIDRDGSNPINISHGLHPQSWPSWSPDGSKIAYNGGRNIWLVNADGTNPVQVTDQPANYAYISWVSDGMETAIRSSSWGQIKHLSNVE